MPAKKTSESKQPLNKPTKEVLEKLVKEKGYRYAGEKYGVSDNTARRWLMAYGAELEVKCELKARERQGYKKVSGKFVYEKELAKTAGNVKSKSESKKKVDKPAKKEKVIKVAKKEKSVFETTIKVETQTIEHPTEPNQFPVAPVKVIQHQVIDLSKIKNRYSPAELVDFEVRIRAKIKEGFEDMCVLKETLSRTTDNGTDDTAASGNVFEEGTAAMERENLTELVAKKQKHLNALQAAIARIGNGTYGICLVTGNLIPKERLYAVPHATKCVEAKKDSDNGKLVPIIEPEPAEKAERHLLD